MKNQKALPAIIVSFCFTLIFYLNANGQRPGSIDSTFQPSVGQNYSFTSAFQDPNGKIIVGGLLSGTLQTTSISRYNSNGTLDPTFTPVNLHDKGGVLSVIPWNNSTILCGGYFQNYSNIPTNYICRFTSTGSLDSSFSPSSGPNRPVTGIIANNDGTKIYLFGQFTSYGGVSRNYLARIDSNGSLDTTFSPGTGVDGQVNGGLVQPDGKLVFWGFFSQYNGVSRSGIVRVNTDGSIDSSFSGGLGPNYVIQNVARQVDGKFVVVGSFSQFNGSSFYNIVRLNSDGTIDSSFTPGAGSNNFITCVKIDNSGKILIGGSFSTYGGFPRRGIARLNPNGSLDQTFQPGLGAQGGDVRDIVLLNDGNILIVGEFSRYDRSYVSGIAKILTSGSCSTTVSPNGTVGISSQGGQRQFSITNNGCTWAVETDSPDWIVFGKPNFGTGNTTFSYTVLPNSSPTPRKGSLFIHGATLTIHQTAFHGNDLPGLYRPNEARFFLKSDQDEDTPPDFDFYYGSQGDIPIVGDWDGDGIDTIGIFRPSISTFYLSSSNTAGNAYIQFPFGDYNGNGDLPLVGDWDGDGIDTIGVYRPTTRQFLLRNQNNGGFADIAFPYGSASDIPIVGDWNGDGIDTIGVYRPSNSTVYLRNSNNEGFADLSFSLGSFGDNPIVGDWDGDGIDTIGFKSAGSNLYLFRNSNSTGVFTQTLTFGTPNDVPVFGNWGQP